MHTPSVINLNTLEKTALALEEINEEVVYVGGAVVGLYVDDAGAEPPRPTTDIDITVQVSTYAQMDQLRERLAGKKIYPALSGTVMYRFSFENIFIDFIPWEDTPLGPTNKWLKRGFEKAYPVTIGKAEIRILPVSFFLASKWEAFRNRGNDPRTSHDLEDIIYVIDNHKNISDEVIKSDEDVKRFLREMSDEILSHKYLNEIIECHLDPFTAGERRDIIIERLHKIRKTDSV